MSLLLFNELVVHLSRLGLFHLVCVEERVLASLLRRHDFRVVHVDLVHSVVRFRSRNVKKKEEYPLSDLKMCFPKEL